MKKSLFKLRKGIDTSTGPKHLSRRSFETIITEATSSMPYYKRTFSKVIHKPSVASASDFLGKTVARPNAILFGAILSFVITIGIYLLSKNLGYRLSGFESTGSFLVGWLAGIIFDTISPIFKNKK